MRKNNPDKRLAVSKAIEVIEECDITSLPVDPSDIASHYNIHYEEAPLKSIDGNLALCDGEFLITVPQFERDSRARFSGAHEIGHFHLPGHTDILYQNHGWHNSDLDFNSENPFEVEANIFAAELLMPSNLLTPVLATETGLEAVKKISSSCESSMESAGLHFVHLSSEPTAIIKSDGDQVNYCVVSDLLRDMSHSVLRTLPKKGSSLPKKSATYSLNMNGFNGNEKKNICPFTEWFPGSDIEDEVREEAIRLGRYGTLTVLTLQKKPPEYELQPSVRSGSLP